MKAKRKDKLKVGFVKYVIILILEKKLPILNLKPDMQKVETLPLADFLLKISAYWENQSPLVELTNFHQFSDNFR